MQDNKAVLLRNDVIIQSNATTMKTKGSSIVLMQQQTNIPGMVDSGSGSGTATTGGAVHVRRTGLTSVSSQQPTFPVVVDWRANPRVPMLGQTIVIEAANATSLTYHIE